MPKDLDGSPRGAMREFDSGATRNVDASKNDYEAFISPLVVEAYGDYMNMNRLQADGELRDGDNWQKGIPLVSYMKSMWRHFLDVWKAHRGLRVQDGIVIALAALIFNASGYLHEILKKDPNAMKKAVAAAKSRRSNVHQSPNN